MRNSSWRGREAVLIPLIDIYISAERSWPNPAFLYQFLRKNLISAHKIADFSKLASTWHKLGIAWHHGSRWSQQPKMTELTDDLTKLKKRWPMVKQSFIIQQTEVGEGYWLLFSVTHCYSADNDRIKPKLTKVFVSIGMNGVGMGMEWGWGNWSWPRA